VAIEFIVDCL